MSDRFYSTVLIFSMVKNQTVGQIKAFHFFSFWTFTQNKYSMNEQNHYLLPLFKMLLPSCMHWVVFEQRPQIPQLDGSCWYLIHTQKTCVEPLSDQTDKLLTCAPMWCQQEGKILFHPVTFCGGGEKRVYREFFFLCSAKTLVLVDFFMNFVWNLSLVRSLFFRCVFIQYSVAEPEASAAQVGQIKMVLCEIPSLFPWTVMQQMNSNKMSEFCTQKKLIDFGG